MSAYVEMYYSFDLARPENHLRPGSFYSFNRHNEVNLNLGMVKLNYAKNNVRGNLALMAGTYSRSTTWPLSPNCFAACSRLMQA